MKRMASLTLALVVLTTGLALAEGTEEFANRLSGMTHSNCPAPIESTTPSTYPLDGN